LIISGLLFLVGSVVAIQIETLQSENITTESFDALGNVTELSDSEANASIQYRETGLY
jgi:hypothetical protein